MQDADATAEAFAARRAAVTARIRAETGIDEAMIERLVRAFYARIADDQILGPIFADRITDWEPHLRRMFAFWSSVALVSGVYHGRPMQAHVLLPIDARHFDRWLEIFRDTAEAICPPAAARHFIERAGAVAVGLEGGVATLNGVALAPGQRYRNRDLS